MIVSIGQPCYLPWLGYFDRIAKSDLHIVLDHVQMDHSSKTNFTNRNRIPTPQGWTWLTIPIMSRDKFAPINEIRINLEHEWRAKHWAGIRAAYSKAPFFPHYREAFEAIYSKPYKLLIEPIDVITVYLKASLSLTTRCIRSSDLDITSSRSELILDLCREVGATTYMSGPFGRDYLDLASFARAGIEVSFHDYKHPQYTQTVPGFLPYMSSADVLFNHGPRARDIITGVVP